MTTMKSFKKLPWHILFPCFLILSALGYGFYGFDTSVHIMENTTQEEADRLVDEFKNSNPVYAAEIENLRDKFGAPAIASKLKLDTEAIQNSIPIESLNEHLRKKTTPSELPLVQLALNTHLVDDQHAMTSFLENFYPPIAFHQDDTIRKNILNTLNEASKSKSDWKVVSSHFSGPLVWQSTRNAPELWNFYASNHTWLEEPILLAILNETFVREEVLELENPLDAQERMRNILAVAQKYENIFAKIRSDFNEQLAFVFNVLELHGGAVQVAINRNGLPAGEVIEVLFANPDYLLTMTDNEEYNRVISENGAARLAEIYRENQNVWNYAKSTPLALQLYDDAPDQADKVLEDYGNNPAFFIQLYDHYDIRNDEGNSIIMPHIAKSLVKYGDLAAHILYTYRDNNTFQEVLTYPEVGFRAIPYVARYPDQLPRLKNNPDWINKNFDQEGKYIDDEGWYEAIPGGSIIKIVSNIKRGVPCSWSEIGWAAFDVADSALFCVSAGTSKAVTSGVKSGVKSATKKTVSGVKTAFGKAKSFGNRSLDKIKDGISWLSHTRKAKNSSNLMRKTVRSSIGTSLIKNQSKKNIFQRLIKNSDKILLKVDDVPLNKLRIAACMIAFTKIYMRSDALGKAPEQIGQFMGKMAHAVIQGIGEIFANAAKEFIPQNIKNHVSTWFFHVFIVALLILLSFFSWKLLKHKQVNQL